MRYDLLRSCRRSKRLFASRQAGGHGIGVPEVRTALRAMLEESSIPASAVAAAIGFAVSQPEKVDVNELIVRPTAQG
jgi:hypothetical protein